MHDLNDIKKLDELVSQISLQLEKNIELASKGKVRAEARGESSIVVVINLLQFIQISLYDLAILIESLKGVDGWKFKFFARQLYLTAHETLDDIQALLGKSFREALIAIDANELISNMFREVGKDFNLIKKKYRINLYNVRHYIAAHRDHDAEKQIKYINSISTKEVEHIQTDLLCCSLKFLKAMDALFPTIISIIKNA